MWYDNAIEIVNRFGVEVIPLSKKGTPVFTWVHYGDAPDNKRPSSDGKTIKLWSTRWPAYGVIAGEDLLIVDIDVKEGQNGRASIKFLKDQGLPLDTFSVKTPSGGVHLYYNTPIHYTPKQGAGLNVSFEDEDVRHEWDVLQRDFKSSGVDTRHCNGYVVGPGSVTDKGEYRVISNNGLKDIPVTMHIGRTNQVTVSSALRTEPKAEVLGSSIPEGRRDEAILQFTMDLARKNLPDDFARALIIERLKDCEGSDAPTFENAWDKYTRALNKVDDILDKLIMEYVYVSTNQRVLCIDSNMVSKLDDFKREFENRMVNLEVTTSNGDIKAKKENPVNVWMKDIDRKTVTEIIFDPRFEHGVVELCPQDGYVRGVYYNQYMPPDIPEAEYTDTGEDIFNACIKVIENVISDETDRKWFIRWLAMAVINPSFRAAWHFHIFGSERGSGKTTLTKIVKAMCGEGNCRDLDVDCLNKDFNMELFSCVIGFFNDFSKVPSSAYNKVNTAFKRITGTDGYTKQAKYAESVQSPVFIKFIMTSNSYTDFPVDEGDRRLYKVESKGYKMDARTMILAHGIVGMHGSTVDERSKHGIFIDQKDVDYARAAFLSYLKESDYDVLYSQRDCPYNAIKEENSEIASINYISKISSYIRHEVFVFKSDIITKQMMQLVLDQLHVDVKVELVLRQAEENGIISRVPYKVDHGRLITKQVKQGHLVYDKDTDTIFESGKQVNTLAYCVRNYDLWMDINKKRPLKKEINMSIDRVYPHKENKGIKSIMDNVSDIGSGK